MRLALRRVAASLTSVDSVPTALLSTRGRTLSVNPLSVTRPLCRLSDSVKPTPTRMFATDSLKGELVQTFLNLEKLDISLYRSTHQMANMNTTVVYGGQVIGQALVAASKTVSQDFHPHSLHCYFIRAGNSNIPILYQVDRVRDGRSFCTRGVKAIQEGETIFAAQVSFHKDEPDSVFHQDQMPKVPQPEELKDAEELLRELLKRPDLTERQRESINFRISSTTTFSVRPCYPEAYMRTKASDGRLLLWVKAKDAIGDNDRLNQCVLAYMSDHSMVATALLPHRTSGFQLGMTLSLDHIMWFHRRHVQDVGKEWMLYETQSPIAAASRGFTVGRLWNRKGELLISTAQECLIRARRAKLGETQKAHILDDLPALDPVGG